MPAAGEIRHTRERMVQAIQRVAREIGRTPSARGSYVAYRTAQEPTPSMILAEFGSWDAALVAAGFLPNKRTALPEHGFGGRRYTDAEIIEALRSAVDRSGGYLTVVRYEELRRTGDPSSALIRRRWRKSIGTWAEIVAHCGGVSGGSHHPRDEQ